MRKQHACPSTLVEAVWYFRDAKVCLQFLRDLRWPNGVVCPSCGSREVTFLANARLWKCRVKHDRQKFSIKVGTIFEDSAIGLDRWLPAIWMVTNCKNGISSCEMARALGVTQKTAWFMDHRIRLAMHDASFERKMSGESRRDLHRRQGSQRARRGGSAASQELVGRTNPQSWELLSGAARYAHSLFQIAERRPCKLK